MKPKSIRFWWFRVWRLALASSKRGHVGGWRRLWWCLWWDLRLALPEPILRESGPSPFPAQPSDPHIHVLAYPDTVMLCGLDSTGNRGLRWTTEWARATCPQCREQGAWVEMSYRVRTR